MSMNNPLNFLPGPVYTAPEVQQAFKAPYISHRGDSCLSMMAEIRNNLCQLTNATHAQVILGSGTLSNEIVAAQLGLLETEGLILANGEFGERLITNAERAQLNFSRVQLPWGDKFNIDEVERAIAQLPAGGWLWAVHHETSTGILNPIDALKVLCARYNVRLCLDCISSIGSMPVDLTGTYLATAVSGKGLGSYPGISIVFHDYVPIPQPQLLSGYIDLGNWAANDSIPYTHSSNLLNALATALSLATSDRMDEINSKMLWLRQKIKECELNILAPLEDACPAIVTIAPKQPNLAMVLGDALEKRGFWLSYRSNYLRNRNWIQIAMLGNPPQSSLDLLVSSIQEILSEALIPEQSI